MLTIDQISRRQSTPLVMATAYDFPFAAILEAAGVDIILVGDSLANVVLGLPSTRAIGMEEMTQCVAAAARGAPNTHVMADMPYGSYATPELAVQHGKRFLTLGASSVKLEGPELEVVRALVAAQVPVMGHIGVQPQTAASFRPVGKSDASRQQLLQEAHDLQAAGIFSLLLENVEAETARAITDSIAVSTIGIGSGKGVSGQVQVLHDLLGLSDHPPPFAKAFASLRAQALNGVRAYADAVRRGEFP
jgi:3-methyl-2-oxobutanoate hydroxymethyltransferase